MLTKIRHIKLQKIWRQLEPLGWGGANVAAGRYDALPTRPNAAPPWVRPLGRELRFHPALVMLEAQSCQIR